ncbi:uncharacterized protein METZ01_LOCUS500608, partial [marine metagenome]
DSFGDGWNGNIFELSDSGGNIVASGTLEEGSEGSDNFTLEGGMRDLLGYEVYRDNQLLDFTTATQYLDNNNLNYLVTYCYNVLAVYDEGGSGFSNTACATPQLGEPSSLSAMGEGDHIVLAWVAFPDNAQTGFNIYRDGSFLDYTSEFEYSDFATVHDIDYCYTVTAVYVEGESPPTNEACAFWSLYPPHNVNAEAGDGYVDLAWEEPVGAIEETIQYDDGVLANAFYFFDIYE